MRDVDEIILAHDKIECVLKGQIGPISRKERDLLTMSRDALCFALGHGGEGYAQFMHNIDALDRRADEMGFELAPAAAQEVMALEE